MNVEGQEHRLGSVVRDGEVLNWCLTHDRLAAHAYIPEPSAVGGNEPIVLPTMGRCGTCGQDVARVVDIGVDSVLIGSWKHLWQALEAAHRVTVVAVESA